MFSNEKTIKETRYNLFYICLTKCIRNDLQTNVILFFTEHYILITCGKILSFIANSQFYTSILTDFEYIKTKKSHRTFTRYIFEKDVTSIKAAITFIAGMRNSATRLQCSLRTACYFI